MKIRSHSESQLVERDDGSRWQIFPGDLDITLNWKPETEHSVVVVDDEVSSHALLGEGGKVRVIPAGKSWPMRQVKSVPQGRLRPLAAAARPTSVIDISGWERLGLDQAELAESCHELMIEHRRADRGFAEKPPQKIALQIGQIHPRIHLLAPEGHRASGIGGIAINAPRIGRGRVADRGTRS